ncbi:hypothetical protein ANCDUO_22384 [Ancylostoma duodenale]|uniref:Uncharacterized protein n=1 Tax=Ancylostoma duodenale TaxID=51022 RepID=A0A0C2BUD8_9BILA|nr:hypothetical protein ANCDUO_22384 [Ancylostoma duodenale]
MELSNGLLAVLPTLSLVTSIMAKLRPFQIFVLFNVDGYTTADIDYFWGRQKSDHRQGAVAFDKFMLPQFKQTGYNVNITKAVTSSGEYVRLYFEVLLVRNMGFYSMNIVIPSMLIVTISWKLFTLPPHKYMVPEPAAILTNQ